MLEVKSHWLGGADANKRANTRLAIQARELEGLSTSIGMGIDDFAMITFGTRMGSNVNEAIAVDLSPYDPIVRLRFAKEFSRLFDAAHGTQGPTPNFNMSCMFGALDEPYKGGFTQPRDVLIRTVEMTYKGFIGAMVAIEDVDRNVYNGTVTSVGATRNLVDRHAYYAQFYDEGQMRVDRDGRFMVREHLMSLGELAIDLDCITAIETA